MYEYRVKKVLKVVDGDTIDVDIDLGFNISYTQRELDWRELIPLNLAQKTHERRHWGLR
jgi:hypothetical protein